MDSLWYSCTFSRCLSKFVPIVCVQALPFVYECEHVSVLLVSLNQNSVTLSFLKLAAVFVCVTSMCPNSRKAFLFAVGKAVITNTLFTVHFYLLLQITVREIREKNWCLFPNTPKTSK